MLKHVGKTGDMRFKTRVLRDRRNLRKSSEEQNLV